MRKVRLSKVKCETLSWAVPSAWCMIVAHNNYQYRTALLRSVVRQQLTRMSIVDGYHPVLSTHGRILLFYLSKDFSCMFERGHRCRRVMYCNVIGLDWTGSKIYCMFSRRLLSGGEVQCRCARGCGAVCACT